MNKADNPKMIGSVLKTVEVLNLLGNSETGLGATEIGTALGYGASAVYHLLNTLKHCHYVVQDERTKNTTLAMGCSVCVLPPNDITRFPTLRSLTWNIWLTFLGKPPI